MTRRAALPAAVADLAGPRLLTIPKAARRWPELGHPSTLYRRWRAGELPPGSVVVLGRRPYLRVAVVEAWLDGQDATPAAPERLRAVR
jgi:hypothetical protein